MHHVRRIAHQQHLAGNIGVGQLATQREGDAAGDRTHFAQPRFEGAGEFAAESVVLQRQHAIRFFVGQGPDDGAAPVHER